MEIIHLQKEQSLQNIDLTLYPPSSDEDSSQKNLISPAFRRRCLHFPWKDSNDVADDDDDDDDDDGDDDDDDDDADDASNLLFPLYHYSSCKSPTANPSTTMPLRQYQTRFGHHW